MNYVTTVKGLNNNKSRGNKAVMNIILYELAHTGTVPNENEHIRWWMNIILHIQTSM